MCQVVGQAVVNPRALKVAPHLSWIVAYSKETDRPEQLFGPDGWCRGQQSLDRSEMCGGCDACLLAQAIHYEMPITKHATKQAAEAVFAVDTLYHAGLEKDKG
jgi:hypothetical protein